MAAVIDLITDALIGSTIKGSDEVISDTDANICLRRLQRLLDSWSNEPLLIYTTPDEIFTMTPNVASYPTSMLPDGRPVSIDSIFVRLSNIDYVVDLVDQQTFDAIPYKITTSVPNVCYYEPSFPDGVFNFYPVPYAAFFCHVITRQPLTGALTLTASIDLPKGYEKAIVDSLAADIWTSFKGSAPVPPDVKMMAREAQNNLRMTNTMVMEMNTGMENDWSNISNAFLYRGF